MANDEGFEGRLFCSGSLLVLVDEKWAILIVMMQFYGREGPSEDLW